MSINISYFVKVMQELNLPVYQFKYKESAGKLMIFDVFRKKYVVLTPEEWVRQNFLQFLVIEKNYSPSLIVLEQRLKYNELQKRADVLIYDKKGKPLLMVECKAPEVKISQDTFDQLARYNMSFKVRYLVVTNGMDHFCCKMDYEANSYQFLEEIPAF